MLLTSDRLGMVVGVSAAVDPHGGTITQRYSTCGKERVVVLDTASLGNVQHSDIRLTLSYLHLGQTHTIFFRRSTVFGECCARYTLFVLSKHACFVTSLKLGLSNFTMLVYGTSR